MVVRLETEEACLAFAKSVKGKMVREVASPPALHKSRLRPTSGQHEWCQFPRIYAAARKSGHSPL
jgi:hypothetical protein